MFYYGETIMGVDNINLSLTSSNTNILVAYNYKQLSQYDENGKINPDYFDSPELIIENSLRTYWLKPDKQYLMYSNNEGIYEPILNKNLFKI